MKELFQSFKFSFIIFPFRILSWIEEVPNTISHLNALASRPRPTCFDANYETFSERNFV
jgi:hypothetical protein